MQLPQVGTAVTVRVRNPQWANRGAYAFEVQEFDTYTGSVYPEQKWQAGQPVLNLTTTIPWFPWRAIPLEDIVDISTGDGSRFDLTLPAKTEDRIWEITGSKGNVYTVMERSGQRSCTCPGFQFRRHCRHTQEVA